MNTEQSTARQPRLLMAIIIVLALIVGAGAFLLLGGGDDAPADETVSTPAETQTDDEAATADASSAPAEADADAADAEASDTDADEPAATTDGNEATAEESSDRPPLPTMVVGVDEEGFEIVVELQITDICAQTFHQALDANSPSFIRWSYGAPGLEPGQTVKVSNDAGFEHFTVVTPDYKIVVEQGINSYGDYPFPTIGWNVDDESSTSIDIDGTHTVDDKEGEASETCIDESA